jgi:hypothetical protein
MCISFTLHFPSLPARWNLVDPLKLFTLPTAQPLFQVINSPYHPGFYDSPSLPSSHSSTHPGSLSLQKPPRNPNLVANQQTTPYQPSVESERAPIIRAPSSNQERIERSSPPPLPCTLIPMTSNRPCRWSTTVRTPQPGI